MAVHKGSWFGLPDFGITEKIQSIVAPQAPRTAQGGSNLFGAPKAQAPVAGSYGQTLGATQYGPQLPAGPVNPSTGGQSVGGGGGGNGGTINLTPPSFDQPDNSRLDQLRSAYSSARDSISSQSGLLDSSYNTAKGDIEGALSDAQNQATTQKDTLGTQFGDVLKNQLKTYQDLGRQRQGTFSALGTLDSSAYGEQQFRADQGLADQRSQTELQKTSALKSVDDQFNTFQRTATSQLADLGNQYQAGKNAIAAALSNNDIQEADAIQSALDNISQQANQIQNSLINFGNQAQLLKAQGYNVKTNIAGVNGNQYATDTANFLNNYTGAQQNLLKVPTNNAQGSGIIGAGTKKDDLNRLLAGLSASA